MSPVNEGLCMNMCCSMLSKNQKFVELKAAFVILCAYFKLFMVLNGKC